MLAQVTNTGAAGCGPTAGSGLSLPLTLGVDRYLCLWPWVGAQSLEVGHLAEEVLGFSQVLDTLPQRDTIWVLGDVVSLSRDTFLLFVREMWGRWPVWTCCFTGCGSLY